MGRWFWLLLALVVSAAGANRLTTFAWDAGLNWPVGTTVELCGNGGVCQTGITDTQATLDLPVQPGEVIQGRVRAVAPAGYQCGDPPIPCPYSDWVDVAQTWPLPGIGSWANVENKSMASVVQYADAYSAQVAFSGDVTTGNVVVIIAMGSSAATSPSRVSGTATVGSFSNVTQRSVANAVLQLFYASVTGSGSLTLGYSGGGDAGITIVELNGVDVTTVEAENYTTTPSQNPSVNLTAASGSVLIAALIDEAASSGTVTAGTAPATWTLIGNQTGHQHAAQALVLSSGITNSACTLNTTGTPGSTYSVYQVVSFKAASSGSASSGSSFDGPFVGAFRGSVR